jgi:hypothetical protein
MYMCRHSCHLCPFQAHLVRLTCQADLLRLSCPNCIVPALLSQLSCSRCSISTATVVLSQLSCLSCPVLAAMFWLFCLRFLSWLYYPICVSSGFPVPALLSWPGCPFQAVVYQLSCPKCLSQWILACKAFPNKWGEGGLISHL